MLIENKKPEKQETEKDYLEAKRIHLVKEELRMQKP